VQGVARGAESVKKIAILDGYNVIHAVPELERKLAHGLEAARRALGVLCADWLTRRRDIAEFRVVFDGDSSVGTPEQGAMKGVRFIYSPSGQSADRWIADMLHDLNLARNGVVVSNDRAVAANAAAAGADVWSVDRFTGMMSRGSGGAESGGTDKPDPNSRQAAAINARLIQEWGLESENR